jgi:hypothetical protein
MTIEILIYPVLVFLAVTLTAKLIERQSDVPIGAINSMRSWSPSV